MGALTLERQAVDIHKTTVDVKLEVPTYSSRPMRVTRKSRHLALPIGAAIARNFYGNGVTPIYGSGESLRDRGSGWVEQTWKERAVLPGGRAVATFEDNTSAIVTTRRTMYIGRNTCWMNAEFADVIAQFMRHTDVQRKAYVRDGAGVEVAPLDIVLTETPTKWVVYATNSPQTLQYDGSSLEGVRLGLPGNGDVTELFSGKTLRSRDRGGLREVVLDFQVGEAKIIVSNKARPLGITFRNLSCVNMGGSGDGYPTFHPATFWPFAIETLGSGGRSAEKGGVWRLDAQGAARADKRGVNGK